MNTSQLELLRPMFFMVFVTFVVWVYMYFLRITHMRKKKIHPEKLKLAGAQADELLRDVDHPSDNFVNLFEVPVLFYVAILVTIVTNQTSDLLIGLAWAYVALRALHSLIHCTYNRVLHRFFSYFLSTLVLAGYWIVLWVDYANRSLGKS
ncbi:MAG: MAPEG family protein [Bdellovibrionales bacterium]|nr:MAPEG family protein [Bdellovibrionales bacterium]